MANKNVTILIAQIAFILPSFAFAQSTTTPEVITTDEHNMIFMLWVFAVFCAGFTSITKLWRAL